MGISGNGNATYEITGIWCDLSWLSGEVVLSGKPTQLNDQSHVGIKGLYII